MKSKKITLILSFMLAFVLIFGIVALVLMCIYNPKAIKARDDKYRAKAGKPLDDALVGRK